MDDKQTGIYFYDDIHPEDNAMMQALYSRSPKSVLEHLEKVKQVGSGKFMASYYVGYGHASIGDCGSTTGYVENVSMLVAKAIQDTPLYKGQEASTRYLDFSQQPQVDPYDHPASKAIMEKWLGLYNEYMPLMIEALKQRYPFDAADGKKEAVWENNVKVRAFDILRSLLPVGTTTLLSWHTDLRHARDHLRHLRAHPLPEVREVANSIFDIIAQKYPNSINGEEMKADSERYAMRNAYDDAFAAENHYLHYDKVLRRLTTAESAVVANGGVAVNDALFDVKGANEVEGETFAARPSGGVMPRRLMEYGTYKFTFLLDFGSYRDLQRHRNGLCQNPVIGNRFGFHTWYRDEMESLLPPTQYGSLINAINANLKAIDELPQQGVTTDEITNQYLYPMGMACLVQLTYSLPQTVYVAELRSGKTVHPSLRPVAQAMAKAVQQRHPALKLYADYDEDSWTLKRGTQDIVERPKEAKLG